MTQNYGANWNYPLSKASKEKFDYVYSPDNKPTASDIGALSEDYKYGTGSETISRIAPKTTRVFWGLGDMTITLVGTSFTKGDEIELRYNFTGSAVYTISNSTGVIFIPDGTSDVSHTITGNVTVRLRSHSGNSDLMITSVTT